MPLLPLCSQIDGGATVNSLLGDTFSRKNNTHGSRLHDRDPQFASRILGAMTQSCYIGTRDIRSRVIRGPYCTIHGWSWWWHGSLHHQAISIYGVDLVLWGYSSPGARKVNACTKIVWLLCWYCVFRFLTLFYPLITVYFSQADKLIGLNWYQHYYIGLIEVWYDIYRQTSNWGMDG